MAIGKAELVERMSKGMDVSKKLAEQALAGTLEAIQGALLGGEEITLKDFGKFALSISAGREGRNPQDPSKTIQIAPAAHVRFKAGTNLACMLDTKETVSAIAKNNTKFADAAKAWKATHK